MKEFYDLLKKLQRLDTTFKKQRFYNENIEGQIMSFSMYVTDVTENCLYGNLHQDSRFTFGLDDSSFRLDYNKSEYCNEVRKLSEGQFIEGTMRIQKVNLTWRNWTGELISLKT